MRARNIKPSLFKNELLGEADPLLTLLFEGLWCLADREGRLEDRPKRIKAEVFPYREGLDINGYLTELERMGFICRYSVDNSQFIQVENFTKHQSPHKTERASEIPEKLLESDTCNQSVEAPLNNGSLTVKESLIPDSGFLIPDSLIPDSNTPPNPPEGEADSPESKPGKPSSRTKATKQKAQPQASDFDWSQWPGLPDQQILSDWFAMRKEKRAKVSQTVVDTFGREVTKAVEHGFTVDAAMAECVTRGWQGFKAEWLINQTRGQPHAPGQRIDNSAAGRIRANAQRELEEIRRQEENDHALATDGQHVWP